MNKTKIEWCDSTWNPVTGCQHKCEYCYARKIANRFCGCIIDKTKYNCRLDGTEAGVFAEITEKMHRKTKNGATVTAPYPFGFVPTFHRYKLNKPQSQKKPRTIFVCSMADLFGWWVPDEWIDEVFAACEKAPQHTYLFLTKNLQRYTELDLAGKLPQRDNMWYGVTAWDRLSLEWASRRFGKLKNHNTFFSIDPIWENLVIRENHRLFNADWIIVGAETGNRKGKIIPEKEWIYNLCEISDSLNTPIFMKDSLFPIIGKENMRREFPWVPKNNANNREICEQLNSRGDHNG